MFTKICTKTSLVVKIEDHNNTSYDKHYVISKLGLSKATIVIPLSIFSNTQFIEEKESPFLSQAQYHMEEQKIYTD